MGKWWPTENVLLYNVYNHRNTFCLSILAAHNPTAKTYTSDVILYIIWYTSCDGRDRWTLETRRGTRNNVYRHIIEPVLLLRGFFGLSPSPTYLFFDRLRDRSNNMYNLSYTYWTCDFYWTVRNVIMYRPYTYVGMAVRDWTETKKKTKTIFFTFPYQDEIYGIASIIITIAPRPFPLPTLHLDHRAIIIQLILSSARLIWYKARVKMFWDHDIPLNRIIHRTDGVLDR